MVNKPCPFCGKEVDLEDMDTLYPSGIMWRYMEDLGCNVYHGRARQQDGDGTCYTMHCPTGSGGCGAEMSADSKEEALSAWNKRSNN